MGLALPIWNLMLDKLPRGDMLSFGHQDIRFTWKEVEGKAIVAYAIRNAGVFGGLTPNTQALFSAFGWRTLAVDLFPGDAKERKVDLNEPLPKDLIGRFDAVLDVGTGEHVFNIGQVFRNALAALKVGGAVLHLHPLVMRNHGFWCTQPTAMLDFYKQNGCDVDVWVHDGFESWEPATTLRTDEAKHKTYTVGFATKRRDVEFKWPVQTTYKGQTEYDR